MPWNFLTKLTEIINKNPGNETGAAAKVLKFEFDRLNKQKCAYCDGFGHSGNDCPTDFKVSQLRGGVQEQTKVIQMIRK